MSNRTEKTEIQAGLRASAIVVGLCLSTNVNAVTLTKLFTSTTNVTVSASSSTSTPLSPLLPLYTRMVDPPTYEMSGSVLGYEEFDSFTYGPTPKIDYINIIQAVTHSKSDTAFGTGCYFGGCDTAQATTKFTGSPIETLGVSVGPVSLALMTGVSADLELTIATQFHPEHWTNFAQGLITDPFHFTGLVGDEGIAVTNRLGAGMSATFETGVGELQEIRRTLDATTDIPGLENLYSLTMSLGAADDGSPGILVDFNSHALLSLNDAIIEQAILDAMVLDLSTSTFTLMADILLFDGYVPRQGRSDFTLAFSDGVAVKSFDVPYNYARYTGRTVAADPQAVPEPPVLALLLGALPMALFIGRRRRRTGECGQTIAERTLNAVRPYEASNSVHRPSV